MSEISGDEALDNWQQQLEEVTALQAICGDDFAILAEGFGSGDDTAAVVSEEMAASLPLEPLECQAAVHVEVPQGGLALQMDERRADGNDGVGAGADSPAAAGLRVKHLPPLCLRLRFPRGYPSAEPPDVTVTALWLSADDSAALIAQLDHLWHEQGAGPICYVWIDWLQANALAAVGASHDLRLDRIAAGRHSGQSSSAQQQQQLVQYAAPGQQQQQRRRRQQQPSTDVQQATPDQPPPGRLREPTRERQRHRQRRQPDIRQAPQEAQPANGAPPAGASLSADAPAWTPGAAADAPTSSARQPDPSSDATPDVTAGGSTEHESATPHRDEAPSPADGATQGGDHTSSGPAADAARPPDELCMQLMLFDAARSYALFRQRTWQCPVCFEEKPGVQCVRLDGCHHVFCAECATTHASLHVKEGSLDALRCLEPSCKERLSRELLEALLGPEAVQRVDDLSLQRALDRMADLIYCPRCQAPALEDDDHCTQCARCFFVFCSLCNDSWHPGSQCMDPGLRLQVLQQRMAGNKDAARDFKLKAQECMSLARIKDTAKQCPSCGMATEKTEGCNKMVCGNCGGYWCWKFLMESQHDTLVLLCRCCNSIKGYDHYREGTCVLFDDAEIARWNREWDANLVRQEALFVQQQYWPAEEAEGIPQRVRRHHCPTCGAANTRMQNNNHITCWACTSSFCAVCRQQLRGQGGKHFGGKNKCKQHTRD